MIICLDLDGVLCKNVGEYEERCPFPDRVGLVNELHAQGHTIVIDTARGSVSGNDWMGRTLKQLEGWGLKFDRLLVGRKPAADVYVDDRAISPEEFFGEWEASIEA